MWVKIQTLQCQTTWQTYWTEQCVLNCYGSNRMSLWQTNNTTKNEAVVGCTVIISYLILRHTSKALRRRSGSRSKVVCVQHTPCIQTKRFEKPYVKKFDVLLTVHLSIFISVINQLDAKNICFTISLFHASTCFEHMCSSSGGQNCITQPLVSSHL